MDQGGLEVPRGGSSKENPPEPRGNEPKHEKKEAGENEFDPTSSTATNLATTITIAENRERFESTGKRKEISERRWTGERGKEASRRIIWIRQNEMIRCDAMRFDSIRVFYLFILYSKKKKQKQNMQALLVPGQMTRLFSRMVSLLTKKTRKEQKV